VDVSLEGPRAIALQAQLQASGVSMIHCPHFSMKEVVDRALTVDMLVFAFDSFAPATVVIITGDRDFTYAISTLRMRGHRVVLIMPSERTPSHLRDNVDVAVSWKDVLEWPEQIAFPRRQQIQYEPIEPPRAQAEHPDIFSTKRAPLLRSAESGISDIFEGEEIVMIPSGSGSYGMDPSPLPNDKAVPVGVASIIAVGQSQSEWLMVEQDDSGTEETEINPEPGVRVEPVTDEDDFLEIFMDVLFDTRLDALRSSPGIGRTPSSEVPSASSAIVAPSSEPELTSVPEDAASEDADEIMPEDLASRPALTVALRPQSPCFQSQLAVRCNPGSSNETSGSRGLASVSVAPTSCAIAITIPKKFEPAFTVELSRRLVNGNSSTINGAPSSARAPKKQSRTTASASQTTSKFAVLVDVLKELRSKNNIRPQLGTVGESLLKRDPNIYRRVGCTKLKKYVEMAREAKLVNAGRNWVELRA